MEAQQGPGNATRRRLRRRPKGAALRAAPLGFVVFHLVRISYVFASFPEPILGRFWFFHLLFSGKGFSTFLAPPKGGLQVGHNAGIPPVQVSP